MYHEVNRAPKIENQSAGRYKHLRHISQFYCVGRESESNIKMVSIWHIFSNTSLGQEVQMVEFGEYNNNNELQQHLLPPVCLNCVRAFYTLSLVFIITIQMETTGKCHSNLFS